MDEPLPAPRCRHQRLSGALWDGTAGLHLGGYNSEISPTLTLRRRPGSSVYNANLIDPAVKRFYSFNTFTLTDEVIRVMADTATAVYDVTATERHVLHFHQVSRERNPPIFWAWATRSISPTESITNRLPMTPPPAQGPVYRLGDRRTHHRAHRHPTGEAEPLPALASQHRLQQPTLSVQSWSIHGQSCILVEQVTTFGTTGARSRVWDMTHRSADWQRDVGTAVVAANGAWEPTQTYHRGSGPPSGDRRRGESLFLLRQAPGQADHDEPRWIAGRGL